MRKIMELDVTIGVDDVTTLRELITKIKKAAGEPHLHDEALPRFVNATVSGQHEARQEVKRLLTELRTAQAEVERLDKLCTQFDGDRHAEAEKNLELQEELDDARAEVARLTEQRNMARLEIENLREDVASVDARAEAAEAHFTALERWTQETLHARPGVAVPDDAREKLIARFDGTNSGPVQLVADLLADIVLAEIELWRSLSGETGKRRCWCGGEVGNREPGDSDGLGCLEDITHDWLSAAPSSPDTGEGAPRFTQAEIHRHVTEVIRGISGKDVGDAVEILVDRLSTNPAVWEEEATLDSRPEDLAPTDEAPAEGPRPRFRVGTHYDIHVYDTHKLYEHEDDRPVCTALSAGYAALIVDALNAYDYAGPQPVSEPADLLERNNDAPRRDDAATRAKGRLAYGRWASSQPAEVPNEEFFESLGRLVRDTWLEWAHEQPDPKPSWLVGWDELDEAQKDVDRLIAAAVYNAAMNDLESDADLSQHPIGTPGEPAEKWCSHCGTTWTAPVETCPECNEEPAKDEAVLRVGDKVAIYDFGVDSGVLATVKRLGNWTGPLVVVPDGTTT